jgi:hypothetical protein
MNIWKCLERTPAQARLRQREFGGPPSSDSTRRIEPERAGGVKRQASGRAG